MASPNVRRASRRAWLTLASLCVVALAVAATAGAVAAAPGAEPPQGPPPKGTTPGADAPGRSVPIPGQYIVALKPGVDVDGFTARERGRGNQVDRVYRFALNGYAGPLTPPDVQRLSNDPEVELVEQDATVSVVATQSNPTWGLDRIDQRALPLNSSYTYSTTASNVTAYIIDTGIRPTHGDFGGRVVAGYDAVGGVSPPTSDCHGHGTHVAGTVGGATYGVAKAVRLVAVRVLNCQGSGTTSGVIAGIDWVTQDHQAGAPAVANMSLGGSASSSLDSAVANSIADGVVYAIAAGNSAANACNYSPARVASALTVGATDNADARASFSNFGSCVDLFAPGVNITSDWKDSDSSTNTISGTSMATPHVAGVAALVLAATPSATVTQVSSAVLDNATPGIVGNPGCGTPNLLLYVGTQAKPSGSSAPANDNFANGTAVSGASGTVSGGTAGATKEAGEPNHAGNAGCSSVWYRLTPTASGTATIDTVGSSFDTLLAVYTGSSVGSLTQRASNDDISYPSNLQSRVSLSVTAGVTYHIAVDGWGGASGSVKLNWSAPSSSSTTTTTSSTTTSTTTTSTTTTSTTTTTTAPPSRTLSIADAAVVEGNRSKRNISFRVTLSQAATFKVTATYTTANWTATAGSDYQAKTGTVTINAGATSATFSVSVYGDRTPEPDEVFFVVLTNPTSGVTFADDAAVGTIINDD